MKNEILENMKNSIGSLCSLLKRDPELLEFLNKSTPQLNYENNSEKLYFYFNGLVEFPKCFCDKKLKFNTFKKGYYKTCGDIECVKKSRVKTNLEKFGYDNPQKSELIKEKTKKTMLERYGVEYAQQNSEIKKLSIETFKNNPNKEEIIKKRVENTDYKKLSEKAMETKKEKWGGLENYYKHINAKIKEVSIKKWDCEHFLQNSEIIEKRVQSYKNTIDEKLLEKLSKGYLLIERGLDYYNIFHSECNKEFKIHRLLFENRYNDNDVICTNCNPIVKNYSKMEKRIVTYLKTIYNGIIIENSIVNDVHCDIYLPEIKLGIEFNGLYWHSNVYKNDDFHLNKTIKFEENGENLIHIFEDEWIHYKERIKKILSLAVNSEKIKPDTNLIDRRFSVIYDFYLENMKILPIKKWKICKKGVLRHEYNENMKNEIYISDCGYYLKDYF